MTVKREKFRGSYYVVQRTGGKKNTIISAVKWHPKKFTVDKGREIIKSDPDNKATLRADKTYFRYDKVGETVAPVNQRFKHKEYSVVATFGNISARSPQIPKLSFQAKKEKALENLEKVIANKEGLISTTVGDVTPQMIKNLERAGYSRADVSYHIVYYTDI